MTNTVGSFTKRQLEIIVGCILGDGYLRQIAGRSDAFLEVNHSFKAKEYVDWKYQELKDFVKSAPKTRQQNKNDLKLAYRFFTQEHPQLTKLFNQFYANGKKIIPKNFSLTPLTLAVWYMDDGSKTKKGDVYLNCQQFDLKSQKRLLHSLRMLKIRARLNKDKRFYRIRILKESQEKFFSIIKPFIQPSMKYKLLSFSDNPVETCQKSWQSPSNAKG
ncbi:MAG: LAGLIDADG endonuclease [Microgenomates group bacterium]